MARLAGSLSATPGNTPDGSPSSSPARGGLTPAPAHQVAPETRAAVIVEELRNAGVDLPAVHRAISTSMNGGPLRTNGAAVYILFQHFPQILHHGIDSANSMALLDALARAAPRARLAPSAPYAPHTPPHAGQASTSTSTPAAAPRREARGANTPLMARLEGSGIDMTHLANSIDRVWRFGASLPADLRRVLQQAGIETDVVPSMGYIGHPLMELRREIHFSTGGSLDAEPPEEQRAPRTVRRRPLGGSALEGIRSRRAAATAARAELDLPERSPTATNAQYAWHVRARNPGASVADIAAAVAGLGNQQVINELNAMIQTHARICAAFSELRPISGAEAKEIGFKDAAIYNEEGDGPFSKDEATTCLFGDELSVRNPDQQVIGLAPAASSPSHGYDVEANKGIVFMDLKKLADYLVANPNHPFNPKKTLNADNIRDFAFRIE
jgi:effector protein HopAB